MMVLPRIAKPRSILTEMVLPGVLLLFIATSASAEMLETCHWFPDLRCERQGRYEGFVIPMSTPFLFEDPFITTGVYTWAVAHDLENNSVFDGGSVLAFAVQARIALTDRLAFIATKDGRASLRPNEPLLDTEKGYLDLMAGFKYALIDWPDKQFILTPSLRYELAQGSDDVLSGNGEGVWVPAVSMGLGIGEAAHLIAGVGARLPVDGDAESTPLFYNLHLDYQVSNAFTPFLEVNGTHYLDDGSGTGTVKLGSGARLSLSAAEAALGTSPQEGLDLLNLGANGVKGNDVISLAVGMRFSLSPKVQLGIAYEFPVTSRHDILKQRLTFNFAFEL